MTEQHHTPLPWVASEGSAGSRSDIRKAGEWGPQETVAVMYGGEHTMVANAHLIVEAVNNFAALQERLEAAEARGARASAFMGVPLEGWTLAAQLMFDAEMEGRTLHDVIASGIAATERESARAEAAKARLRKIADVAVVRGRCVFCAHPDDPADGQHTSTCPVAPESDPCPYVHDSGDRCVLQFEHGGSHDLGY